MTAVPPRVDGAVTYPFELDDFQRRAADALDRGASVLVAAPTGAGKTVVAEHAVARALAEGGKAFYTTPIKALSNQKYADLARRHGADRVGLLTGDNSINGDAPVVVMTTEVLRNMIYAGSRALDGLRFVVLDEVHYLQDAYRGPVWEEVIIHLPPEVALVCPVGHRVERGGGGRVADHRPRPDDAGAGGEAARRAAQPVPGRRPPERAAPPRARPWSTGGPTPRPTGSTTTRSPGGGPAGAAGAPAAGSSRPRRPEVIDMLGERDMLPSLYFIFSRAGCEEAVSACLDAGLRLTTPDERARIRAIVDERTAALTDDDLDVLGYDRWLAALEMGLAAHHAGMVPPFKEAVEACFVEGLVKAVFATETLALGINMPARSVVIERLTKFTGEARAFLTPGEYTQLTGRAGRRGIDDLGYAIVLWSPFVPFDQVASLASSRTYGLRSAFRPTYNMAANLVRRYEPPEAHHLLNLCFAQFQADRAAGAGPRPASSASRSAWPASRRRRRCELGDVGEYRDLARAGARGVHRRARRCGARSSSRCPASCPGDVVEVSGRRLAVLSVAYRKGGTVRLQGIDTDGEPVTIGVEEMVEPPVRLGRLDLPRPYQPNNRAFQHRVADGLRRARPTRRRDRGTDAVDGPDDRPAAGRGRAGRAGRPPGARLPRPRPPRPGPRPVGAGAGASSTSMRRDVRSRTESLARRFDRVLRLLEAWGYLDGWALTERGEVLARTYHESDLLVAEAMCSGLLDGLDPASLAALVSCFTYEHRGPGTAAAAVVPVPPRPAAVERPGDGWPTSCARDEEAAGLPVTRAPDAGFAALAHAWAAGEPLGEVLGDEDLSGGDFVRNVKTLIDLVRQVGDVAPDPATARAARQAADALHRGVVSISSTLDEVVGERRPTGTADDGRVPRDVP